MVFLSDRQRSQPSFQVLDQFGAILTFSGPVIFIQGEDDNITPTSLVADYISKTQAPAKQFRIVPGAGHWVMWTHPDEFLNFLREDVRSASTKPGAAH